MKVLTEYAQTSLAKALLNKVRLSAGKAAKRLGRSPVLMEVCGTHTMAFGRLGIRKLLHNVVDLRSGPGCPVCVTAPEDLDSIFALARLPGTIIATFGDMVRVPGSHGSLEDARAQGAAVRICYSPADAVAMAEAEPEKEVIFVGIGFETTAPTVALALLSARQRGVRNFSVFSVHKLVPPALKALAESPDFQADGLILPGHACAVLGRAPFDFLSSSYNLPAVVTGFEPIDLLGGMIELLEMVGTSKCAVKNGYPRVVKEEGNFKALEIMNEVFVMGGASWRGLDEIPQSGLFIRPEYAHWDARRRWQLEPSRPVVPTGCKCGAVITGGSLPTDCRLFAKGCDPASPLGPCMVSSEGACAAYYQYERGGLANAHLTGSR